MEKNRSIWRDHNFIKFFSANALSNLGNWFDFIAVLILFRYTWNAEPMLIAMIPVMYAIPSTLFGQLAGVFVDRKDKLRILIYSDWIRGCLTLLLVFVSSPIVALLVLLLRNSVGVVGTPAQQGLVRNIVDEDHLMKAVTINGSLLQLVKVVGPLIGGSVSAVFSPDISIGINSASFILSGIILSRIALRNNENNEGTTPDVHVHFLRSWKEGWEIVFKNRILLASILYGMVITLTIQMIDAQLVTLFSEVFPNRTEMTGWTISAIGVGSLLVILILTKLDTIKSYGWFFGTGSLLIGVMTGGLGFLDHQSTFISAICFAFIGGIGTGITFTAVNYMIQKEPPAEAIGRVSGIVDSTLSILFIAGPLLGGVLIHHFGVLLVFRGIGVVLILIGTIGIMMRKVIWKKNMQAAGDGKAGVERKLRRERDLG
ncbi:MFS transporter [Rossellomorea aquimaris]|uniref:MFS transporter n=1 Tax=Rossellomorea aquimaris TaxID=189382 RepID=A0A366ER43_9BACI|nr:MFS transporter [Rossellomorea aquimaris]RBP04406.1 MFS transporter [Rossellomorea aquimaris]